MELGLSGLAVGALPFEPSCWHQIFFGGGVGVGAHSAAQDDLEFLSCLSTWSVRIAGLPPCPTSCHLSPRLSTTLKQNTTKTPMEIHLSLIFPLHLRGCPKQACRPSVVKMKQRALFLSFSVYLLLVLSRRRRRQGYFFLLSSASGLPCIF